MTNWHKNPPQGLQMPYNDFIHNKPMNYTPEQISQIVLKVLKEVETPDFSKLSYEEKIELTKDPNTSQESLKSLATDKNSYVYLDIALDPNTPQETLRLLATDKDIYVRWVVAENPNTPQETLAILATDKSSSVRYWVAKNPNTSQETLAILATDEDSDVRWRVAENPNYKKQTLELTSVQYDALKKLIESGQDEVLKGIL